MINRHFSKSHRLHKIFNRNTVNVSCMQNMSKIYKGHNGKIKSMQQLTLCYCRVKRECFMDSKLQTMDAVYDCFVTSPLLWLAEGKWMQRYYNHKESFNHKHYLHDTKLSNYVWPLKKTLDITPNLKWSVVRSTTP